jgi:hypothetical protein
MVEAHCGAVNCLWKEQKNSEGKYCSDLPGVLIVAGLKVSSVCIQCTAGLRNNQGNLVDNRWRFVLLSISVHAWPEQ